MLYRLFVDQKAIFTVNPQLHLLQTHTKASKEPDFFPPSLVPHPAWPGSIKKETRHNHQIVNSQKPSGRSMAGEAGVSEA